MKNIIIKQYREIVNHSKKQMQDPVIPKEGWVRTVRKTLGMSGAQLARRMNVTRALISNSEKSELSGSLTLKSITKMAEAMNCHFVYAIVPDEFIEFVA